MSRWFRWYQGTTEDGKFRTVARLSRVTIRDVLALWSFLLEDAATLDHPGVCKRNEDFMSAVLDFEDGEVERILAAMEDADLISVGHGAITICNWGKRQFAGDHDPTAAERQARKRERDKLAGNADVTRDSRPPENREQITESKIEANASCAVGKPTRTVRSSDFEEFWKAYPKRDGANPRAPAERAFAAAVRSGADPPAIIAGAKCCAERERDRIGTPYIPQAVKWLRDKRWQDYRAEPGGGRENITTKFYAKPESRELEAWDDYLKRTTGKFAPRNRDGGWHFDSQWPPEMAEAAE